ncbi:MULTISPECIES: hypothetical protein [Leptospira]|uniref:Lipoprotein n=3 Tax=Leptospira weilii TaxID=28184 RepID=A0A828Z2Z8_9LEPT|nr:MULTISPECIES: hypothetical protein [Leptospira]EMM70736.1 hypothetical protein LEP1GSC038_1293 [Leptospira weilii str. 2006001855]EMY12573.1 hypothetical protein LEP1GSC043_3240 [Leptospira weilii str. Ecochallenge]EKR63973.1 hypothetical protein LEP1GSC036_1113 [Leptospira weilii str. 2006001853]EMJ66764.1 hypothetical protein LEP1GSC051_3798 [Leptospira sp. P2653]EMN44950.1 hypothetical protein LEP1GSC086_0198 [Leptospira weilii str. LNT 1234]
MNVLKYKSILFLFFVSFLLGDCIYRDIRIPGLSTNFTQYVLNSDDFQILGTVETEGVYTSWLMFWVTGETGYRELLDKSKALGGDEIINYRFEVEETSILLVVWNRIKWKATAHAIKYREKIKKP